MAEQARKVGARISELREERHWKQRDLVAAMAAHGDQAINTNQLSRYENGHAMPGERRLEYFARALETDVADLMQGPLAERREETGGAPAPDPFATPEAERLGRVEDRLAELSGAVADLDGQLGEVLGLLRQRSLARGGEPPSASALRGAPRKGEVEGES